MRLLKETCNLMWFYRGVVNAILRLSIELLFYLWKQKFGCQLSGMNDTIMYLILVML